MEVQNRLVPALRSKNQRFGGEIEMKTDLPTLAEGLDLDGTDGSEGTTTQTEI